MLNVNGRIDLSRRRFAGGEGGSFCPVDRLLDEAEAVVSVGARQLCCREGMNARSFDRGRQNLKHAAQISVGEEQFRLLVESEGQAVLKASASEQLELDWSASACKVLRPDGQETTRMYVSADGVMVPTTTQQAKDKRRATVLAKRRQMPAAHRKALKRLGAVKKGSDQGFKQVYLTRLYDQNQDHCLVGVTRKDAQGLKKLLRREAARVHLRAAVERLGMVDGAVCLRNNLEELPLEQILLDFYHLSEHVGEAGSRTLGAGSEACQQWVSDLLRTVRHQGYEPFFQKLLDWRSGLRGARRQEADRLIQYVASRREMILYDVCEQNGWDVGSGAMESMCGVSTDRVKGGGRRWDIQNAEAMVALEALYQSTGLWDTYWAKALSNFN